MKKVIIFSAICILLITGGLIWGIYDYATRYNIPASEVTNIIKNYLTSKHQSTITPPKSIAKPTEPPESSKPPQPVISETKPPQPPKPSMSEESAQQLITDAEESYKQFDFDDASDQLKKVIRANLYPILTQQALELSRRCDVFNGLIKNMPRDDVQDLAGLIEIQFNAGQPVIAKLIEEKKTSITVKQDGEEREIQLTEINRYTKLTPEAYQNKLRIEYQKRLSRLANPSAQDYYQITAYCYKKQLNPEALSMLELAWGKDEQFLITLSGRIPETQHVIPHQNLDKEKQLALADEYYKKAREHMDKTYNKGPDFDTENKLARESFKSALAIYQELQETNKDDAFLEIRIKEIEDCLLFIRKQTPINTK